MHVDSFRLVTVNVIVSTVCVARSAETWTWYTFTVLAKWQLFFEERN